MSGETDGNSRHQIVLLGLECRGLRDDENSRHQIVLIGLECRGQPASQRDIILLLLRAALGPGVGVVM